MRLAATVVAGTLIAFGAFAVASFAQKSSSLVAPAAESTANPLPPPSPAQTFKETAEPATTPVEFATSRESIMSVASPSVQALAAPAPRAASSCPGNPNALGVARVVEIDTTGGPGFGFEHFKSHDFLREGEVVLTFDDGPWPKNTPAVLAALAAHCTKAIFFPIGLHATYQPGILKQAVAAGHAIGSHTWCHQDLSKTKGACMIAGKRQTVEYDAKEEIEKGISAVRWAAGAPTAPYFRFPALRQPPELIGYLSQRNIAIFSTDLDSFDFKVRKPEQVRQAVLAKLKKHGKGIVLMHDFQHATAEAAGALLSDLKAGGYKIVFMKPKFNVTTIASYDELVQKELKASSGGAADGPTSSVVREISQ